ncbi:uncharacterized protein LOC116340945 [Contarinia nasturtii]|uniref:uncharacterized protein LOC116340945 n=1 Tax=Contarinia nasturtii TaxID=265458 RepID=UPI0012D3AC40|nr:uncharacterized protein LOC116340945 [Contarinia nasturtii]
MVLIAIDKYSRKILGYLCKNDQNVAYCCSDCDVEFTTAQDLENHMVMHEMVDSIHSNEENNDTDAISEADIPLNIVLSDIEREKQLKMKYQVTPCSVQIFRFDNDDINMDLNTSVISAEKNNDKENIVVKFGDTQCETVKEPSKRPGPASKKNLVNKRQKLMNKEMKKVVKKQSPPPVCYLCGQKFQTQLECDQHSKIHIQNSSNSPVFPCSVCGKNVKNLKMHLRQHKQGNKKNSSANSAAQTRTPTKKPLAVKTIIKMNEFESNDTKVEEASSSTDAVITGLTTYKEPESDVSSNELLTETQDMHSQCRLKDGTINVSQSMNQMPPPADHTTSSKWPPIIVEDYPINHDICVAKELTNEEEPTQSTQQTFAVTDEIQPNHHMDETTASGNPVEETGKKEKKKWLCEVCNKHVCFSYKRTHMKRYHSPTTANNIPIKEQ